MRGIVYTVTFFAPVPAGTVVFSHRLHAFSWDSHAPSDYPQSITITDNSVKETASACIPPLLK